MGTLDRGKNVTWKLVRKASKLSCLEQLLVKFQERADNSCVQRQTSGLHNYNNNTNDNSDNCYYYRLHPEITASVE
jgi:hypothetical protein